MPDHGELILSLCDRTGVAVEPWARGGYECWAVDTAHPPGQNNPAGNVRYIGADVQEWKLPFRKIGLIMAWPPCTDLARSGARWWPQKGVAALASSLQVVAACIKLCEDSGAPWLLENPVGSISTYWRKPDHTFDPCDYAGYLTDPSPEAYTKRTCLWVGGGFRMPVPKPVPPVLGSLMTQLPQTADRQERRSVTPAGFARAVYLANAGQPGRLSTLFPGG